MKLIIASDRGRLSGTSVLSDLSLTSIPSLSTDRGTFLQTLAPYRGPFVLFWHEHAPTVLELLGELARNNIWPAMLSGVTLFRAAHYAGFGTREDAAAAVEASRVPPSRIHILASVVASPPDPAVILRVRRFAEAIRDQTPAIIPFQLLEPEDHGDEVFTLLIIDLLASKGWDCTRETLNAVDWSPVVQQCASLGIEFPADLSIGAIRELGRRLRNLLNIAPTLQCKPCNRRSVWAHTDLQQDIPSRPEPHRTQALAEACARIAPFLSAASDVSTDLERAAIERVDIGCREQLAPALSALVISASNSQCALAGGISRMTAALSATERGLAAGQDPAELARTLAKAMACDAMGTVSLDHDITTDFNH
jgi:hypothetical protein